MVPCRPAGAGPGEQVQDQAWFPTRGRAWVAFGMAAGQPVTVKVADATVPLWRPLAWKVSRRPGIVERRKLPGTANEAATWPPVVALVAASTVAPKVTSTCSEGAKPRHEG